MSHGVYIENFFESTLAHSGDESDTSKSQVAGPKSPCLEMGFGTRGGSSVVSFCGSSSVSTHALLDSSPGPGIVLLGQVSPRQSRG